MTSWNEETDVVVVGSGIAGLCAAVEAAEAGAAVVVIEKMKVTGGNTRISDGGLAAPGCPEQRRQGIEDSPELLAADMLRAGLGLNHPHLVRVVAEQAGAAVAWTREGLGVRYLDRLDRFGGHSVARALTTRSHSGVDLVKAAVARLRDLGVVVRTRCRLEALCTDAAGRVDGVRIRQGYAFPDEASGEVRTIGARRAVVLATGGFGNDVAFRTLQNPTLDASVGTTNQRGATAEALVAALRLQAAPVHLSWIQMGPWGCPDEIGYGTGGRLASYCIYSGGIVVDPATGRRIVDEWADRRRRSDAIIATGHPCVGIVDAAGAAGDTESLTRCLDQGKVRRFDTIRALAAAYDMPAGELESTVGAYNRAIVTGTADPFGKALANGARPINQPPFYAIRLWPKVHYTPGGIGIDADTRVIDIEGRPIPGLFAAGEVCGGVHGASRLGSLALTECVVFGRIAGRRAAGA